MGSERLSGIVTSTFLGACSIFASGEGGITLNVHENGKVNVITIKDSSLEKTTYILESGAYNSLKVGLALVRGYAKLDDRGLLSSDSNVLDVLQYHGAEVGEFLTSIDLDQNQSISRAEAERPVLERIAAARRP